MDLLEFLLETQANVKSQMGEGADYTEIRYEGYGAGGIAIIVEALTDNLNRTASNVRSYFTKAGGNMGQTGSVSHGFDRVGEVSYPVTAGSADDVMMAALDAGADDVESDEDGHWIYCSVEALSDVSEALEKALGGVGRVQAGLASPGAHRGRSRHRAEADEADRFAGGGRRRPDGDPQLRHPRGCGGGAGKRLTSGCCGIEAGGLRGRGPFSFGEWGSGLHISQGIAMVQG